MRAGYDLESLGASASGAEHSGHSFPGMEVTTMRTRLLAALALVFAGAVARADEVKLTSGEVLKVTNVTAAGGRVQMDHPVLGHLNLAADQVVEIVRPDGAKLTGSGGPVPPVVAPPPKWKFKAELGVNGTSGNTRTQDLRAAI